MAKKEMEEYIHSIGVIDTQYLEELKERIEHPSRFDYCINNFGDTIELAYEYGKETIIVPKNKFTPKLYPEYHLGDKVERIDGTRTGIIYRIYWVWHYDDNKKDYFAYYLDYGNRKSTRRTKAIELRKPGSRI